MVTWKRGFLEITAEILEILLKSPLKKSHISFKSKLDSRAVTKYLKIMQEIKLVDKDKDDSSYFAITQKGKKFLEQYSQLIKFVMSKQESGQLV